MQYDEKKAFWSLWSLLWSLFGHFSEKKWAEIFGSFWQKVADFG